MQTKIIDILKFLVIAFCGTPILAQTTESIQKHVEYLASEPLAGRFPGTPGDSLAADYIKNHFAAHSLLPFDSLYYQYFEIKTGVEIGSKNTLTSHKNAFTLFRDFMPLSISAEGKFEAGIFDFNFDSLPDGIIPPGVEKKWLVVEIADYFPTTREFMRWATKASKANATGIIFITSSDTHFSTELSSPLPGSTTSKIETKNGTVIYSQHPKSGMSRMILSRGLVRSDIPLLLVTQKSWEENKKNRIKNNLKSIEVSAFIEINPINRRTHNVIGVVKGSERPDEYIVVGAHYDHLGYGGPESGSRVPEQYAIHYGADDNASGTATVLGLATRIASKPLPVSVIFVAFGAEELGLIGSQYMARNLFVDKNKIKAMFNYDMVGRMEKNQLNIGGVKTATDFQTIIDTLPTVLSITTSPFGSGPSDHSSFNSEEIPVLYFNTGIHTDYHTPADAPAKINFPGILSVLDYSEILLRTISLPQANLTYNKTEATDSQHGSKSALKVTLGIIPDVTGGDNTGLVIMGVNPSGVAHRAQLLKGDKIVNIDGTPIKNVYDYMDKLQQIKPKQVAHITVIREGQEKVFLLQF